MAKLLSDARLGVRTYLDEAAQADFLNTEVDKAINYGMHAVAAAVVEVHEDYYFTTSPKLISTAVNVQEYALDSTLVKIRRVEINYNPSDANSTAQRATAIKTEEFPLRLGDNSIGQSGTFNAGYYVNGQQGSQIIGFTPVPQKAGTNNVSVWGVAMPVDLVNATDAITIPYPDLYTYLIELRAAALLLRKGQQAENYASKYMEEFKDGLLELKNFLKDRQDDGVWMVADAIQEFTTFDHNL